MRRGSGMVVAAALAAALLAAPPVAGEEGAARGRTLAEAKDCGSCHGAAGVSAKPDIPSLAGQQAEFITLQLILFRERLRDAPPMPEMAQGLEDAEIEALAAHFAGLPPGQAPNGQAPRDGERTYAGEKLAERLRCGICHRPDYSGQAQVPRITGQREDYLALSLARYRDGRRHGTDTNMNAVMYGVTDTEIAALAHFLAHQ